MSRIEKEYMTVAQAMEVTKFTKPGVHYLMKAGLVKALRLGKLWLIRRSSLDKYLSEK